MDIVRFYSKENIHRKLAEPHGTVSGCNSGEAHLWVPKGQGIMLISQAKGQGRLYVHVICKPFACMKYFFVQIFIEAERSIFTSLFILLIWCILIK